MAQNVCNICGANYEYKNGKWRCPACGAFKPEELSNEETTLLFSAAQLIRLAQFDEAEEKYRDIVERYPNNPDGYWGLVLAKYGIKYETDYDGKTVPSCYAASYESVLDDPNYKKAITLADKDNKRYYLSQAEKIERIRVEWVEKASKEPPYDIFISYKDTEKENGTERTKDSYEAFELYKMLTDLGYRVFYSRESLKDKSGEKYEPYIFNALNTAQIMIVYSSKAKYVESTWIKNEWMRYYKRIKLGKKQANSLLVVYNGMNPADLPAPLSKVQGLDRMRLDFSRELESYCTRVMRSVVKTIDRVKVGTREGKTSTPGTIQPITLTDHNTVTKKAKRETVGKREIGNGSVLKLTASAENELKVAEAQLAGANYKEAEEAFNTFLLKNPKNGRALLGKLLATNKCVSVDAFSSVGVRDFSDWTLLEQVLSFTDKSTSEIILKALCTETIRACKGEQFDRAKEIYGQIASYESKSVSEMRHKVFELAKGILGTNDSTAKSFIDGYLLYEQDEAIFLAETKRLVEILIAKEDYGFAKEYVDSWSKYEADSLPLNLAVLQVKYEKKQQADLFAEIERKNAYDELDKVLKKLSQNWFDPFFKAIFDRICALLKAGRFDVVYSYADKFLRYDFGERADYIRRILKYVSAHASGESATLFELLLALSGYGSENYARYLGSFADNGLSKGDFAIAEEFYDKANAVFETDSAWEGKLKCSLHVQEEKDFPSHIGGLKDFSYVETILSLAENDDKRTAFIDRLLGYACAAIKKKDPDIEKILSVFDSLIAYFPEGMDDVLVNRLFDVARALKNIGAFDFAEKYYALIVNYDAKNHVAYWEMLQAKLACKNEDEMIRQPRLLSEFQEYNNALLAASEDESALKHYVDTLRDQKSWITQENERRVREKEKKKKKLKFVFRFAAVCVVLVMIVAAVLGVLAYRNKESVLKYDIVEGGISAYPGKYYKAEETLVIPGSIDNKIVTEIRAEAFKGNTTIKKVVIPKTVVKIGDSAFEGCVNLESVEIKDVSVTFLTRSTGSLSLLKTAYADSSGTESSNNDIKLAVIGKKAFKGCSKLSGIVLNEGLLAIGDEAFADTGLKEITIPSTVTQMGASVFARCSKLELIKVVDPDPVLPNWDDDWSQGQKEKVQLSYLVNFDYDGADRADALQQYVVADASYSFPIPQKRGYAFVGWYNGDTQLTNNEGRSLAAWQYQGGITAKAKYNANNNAVVFDGNGATSGEMSPQNVHTAETAKLFKNAFTKTGYAFAGWATSADGEKIYDDESDYLMGKDASYTLFAVWSPNLNTLRFNANGGTGEMDDLQIRTDGTVALPANVFTKDHYGFIGWATEADGTVVYLDQGNYTMGVAAENELFACWGSDSYAIEYVLNGGSKEENPETYSYDSAAFTLKNPTRDGFDFLGWSGTDLEELSKEVTIPQWSVGPRQYTANWEAIDYEISYELDGGEETTNPKVYNAETETFTLAQPTKPGYTFNGWTGTGIDTSEKTVTIEVGSFGPREYVATWQANENTIRFHANGGSGTMNDQKGFTNSTIILTACSFKPALGWEFVGWAKTSNGEVEYLDGGEFQVGTLAAYDLYAIWKEIELFVRVDESGVASATGDYLLFGEYPQTRVENASITSQLNAQAGSLPSSNDSANWTRYEYYYIWWENGNEMRSLQNVWFIDLSYNDNRYRGVYFTSYRDYYALQIGNESSSYQDDNGYYSSNVYWFKFEPIKWRILSESDGEALIFSEMILDSQEYCESDRGTKVNSELIAAHYYEYSNIRKWLNNTFYNIAFSELQKGLISKSLTLNDAAGANTEDYVFILGELDVTSKAYGFNSDYKASDDNRKKTATDYAFSQGVWTDMDSDPSGNSNWWIRPTKGPSAFYGELSMVVGVIGQIGQSSPNNTTVGVVPALKINIK